MFWKKKKVDYMKVGMELMAAMQTPKPEPQIRADVQEILGQIKRQIESIINRVDNIQKQSDGNKDLHILDAKIRAYIDSYLATNRCPDELYEIKNEKDLFFCFHRLFSYAASMFHSSREKYQEIVRLENEKLTLKSENEDLKNRLLGLNKKEDKTE